jgi:predicted 3-demethylubiquinone-9 3-methyltransferase (glyoxalase superfamily)
MRDLPLRVGAHNNRHRRRGRMAKSSPESRPSILDAPGRLSRASGLLASAGPPTGAAIGGWICRGNAMSKPIVPCLWFDANAEEAVNYYVSVFKNSKVVHIDRFSEFGPNHDMTVVVIDFELDGRPFQAFNGGPMFRFSEAISFVVECVDQAEVDYYWDTFTKEGEASQCGWLKDKYGVSWQIVPTGLSALLRDPDRAKAGKVMRRLLEMQKIDVAELQAACDSSAIGDG